MERIYVSTSVATTILPVPYTGMAHMLPGPGVPVDAVTFWTDLPREVLAIIKEHLSSFLKSTGTSDTQDQKRCLQCHRALASDSEAYICSDNMCSLMYWEEFRLKYWENSGSKFLHTCRQHELIFVC